MWTLLGFFTCFTLLSTGSALECEVCGTVGRNCSGSLRTCGAGKDTCTIILNVDTLARDPIYTINKGCGSSSDCRTGPKYLTVGQGKEQRSSTTCCVGNACKTINPQWPPAITKTNGKRCPACYTNSIGTAIKCNERAKVDCVGPEDKCLAMEMTITYGRIVIKSLHRGCATQSMCDYLRGRRSDTPGVRLTINKLECNTAPKA